MGKIILKRKSTYGDKLRAYKIFLDGNEVGKIEDGETWTHSSPEGEHTLQLRMDWCKTPEYKFILKSQTDAEFECHANITAWKIPFAIFFIFMPTKWIVLKMRS